MGADPLLTHGSVTQSDGGNSIRFNIASLDGTTSQVHQTLHAKPFGNFLQLRAGRRQGPSSRSAGSFSNRCRRL